LCKVSYYGSCHDITWLAWRVVMDMHNCDKATNLSRLLESVIECHDVCSPQSVVDDRITSYTREKFKS